LLTDGVDQHPHCVLLLDEIEKAHPDLFNVLLQIMDHGKLTDHNGKQVDFRNVILIMTTNAGAADLAKGTYGFTRNKREGDDIEAINRLFAPEFRNRLDSVITFHHLSQDIIAKVVEKFVLQLEAQLADRNVTIELSDEASRWLIASGYDELMGARPMARVIQENIKKPLADEVLFGRLKDGGHVRVIVGKNEQGGDALGFEYLDGPVTPKPEKLPEVRVKRKRSTPRKPKSGPKGGGEGPRGGSVPKVPLVKA
jgi:ATP-dependent Clp protease ATP-binding subunit ClpA